MASTSHDGKRDGVEFVHENDGSVTARGLEAGLARGGPTRADALEALAEELRLEEGGKPIDDPDTFFGTELDINPDDPSAVQMISTLSVSG
jgi:hypothetical protein